MIEIPGSKVTDGRPIRIDPRPLGSCEAHDHPDRGLARWIVDQMRTRGATGVNVCRECLARAKRALRR